MLATAASRRSGNPGTGLVAETCYVRRTMVKTIDAVFDGTVFKPSEPVPLEPNTRVQITIDTTTPVAEGTSFLRVASKLKLEGPADWSVNLEEYLYGKAEHGA